MSFADLAALAVAGFGGLFLVYYTVALIGLSLYAKQRYGIGLWRAYAIAKHAVHGSIPLEEAAANLGTGSYRSATTPPTPKASTAPPPIRTLADYPVMPVPSGGTSTITITCDSCGGSGLCGPYTDDDSESPCQSCGGSYSFGWRTSINRGSGKVKVRRTTTYAMCSDCGGRGHVEPNDIPASLAFRMSGHPDYQVGLFEKDPGRIAEIQRNRSNLIAAYKRENVEVCRWCTGRGYVERHSDTTVR